MAERNNRKTLVGVVVGNKMTKTAVVKVERQLIHQMYGKTINVSKKFKVHDEKDECSIGDRVKIMETRPLSKTKRWRLEKVITKVQ